MTRDETIEYLRHRIEVSRDQERELTQNVLASAALVTVRKQIGYYEADLRVLLKASYRVF
jgi:hypothetical protein